MVMSENRGCRFILYPANSPLRGACYLTKPHSTELNLFFHLSIPLPLMLLCSAIWQQEKQSSPLHNYYKLFLASSSCTSLLCRKPIWNCSKHDNIHAWIVLGRTAEGFWMMLTLTGEKRYSKIILKCFDSVLILYCRNDALNLTKK